jgi:LCCL domain
MNAISLGVFGVLLAFGAQEPPTPPDLPSAAREVLSQFEDEVAGLTKKYEAEIKKVRARTGEELKKVQDLFCKDAKLDEAVAVRDLIRTMQSGSAVNLGSELPAAAREIYQQHEKDEAAVWKKGAEEVKIRRDKLAGELKKVQDLFCKEAKLDEAVAVRDLIRSLRDETANALPDPGYVNNGPVDIGKVFHFVTTGVNAGQSIYGSDIFTTGSHLGMAAVHSGVLVNGQRGVVKVTILPGQANYVASTRNGVTSIAYGAYGISFKVERVFWFAGKLPAEIPPEKQP